VPTGTGITTDTPTNLVIGAGLILRNHAIFGASMDNNVFRINRENVTAELNGIKGPLKGTHYIRRSEGIIECSIPEVSATVLAAGWPGSNSTPGAGMTVIDEDDTRRLADADYADWELDVERLNGGQFQFEADDAINTGTFEGTLADAEFFRPRYELHATWTAASNNSPHRIRVLDVAS